MQETAILLFPTGKCSCTGTLSAIPGHEVTKIVHLTGIFQAFVFQAKCVSCLAIHHYDFKANLLFKHSQENIFSLEILRDYLNTFREGRSTLFTYHGHLQKNHEDFGYKSINYQLFRRAWISYCSRLVFQEKELFSCNKCESHPNAVLFDATLLACRKDLLIPDPVPVLPVSDVGSQYSSRMAFTKLQREFLQKLSSSKRPMAFATFNNALTMLDQVRKVPLSPPSFPSFFFPFLISVFDNRISLRQ